MPAVLPESTEFEYPRKRRTQFAPRFYPNRRDIEVVRAVHRFRMLERRQIERLFFTLPHGRLTNTNRAQERLRRLWQHAILERIERPIYPGQGSAGPVYRLGPEGARFLARVADEPLGKFEYWGKGDDRDRRKTQVTPLFLEHGLALADVRIEIELAAARHGGRLLWWRDEMELRRAHKTDPMPIVPDGEFILETSQGRGHFFLEVDRHSESLSNKWQKKVLGYKQLLASGEFHRCHGVDQASVGFRVLVVPLTERRAEHIKEAAEKYGSAELASLFLCAPISALQAQDVLGDPFWLRGGLTGRQALL